MIGHIGRIGRTQVNQWLFEFATSDAHRTHIGRFLWPQARRGEGGRAHLYETQDYCVRVYRNGVPPVYRPRGSPAPSLAPPLTKFPLSATLALENPDRAAVTPIEVAMPLSRRSATRIDGGHLYAPLPRT